MILIGELARLKGAGVGTTNRRCNPRARTAEARMPSIDRSIDSLSSDFYPIACEIIARCAARGVAVMIVQTSRTADEHAINVHAGTSHASLSKHQPRADRGLDAEPTKCDAI